MRATYIGKVESNAFWNRLSVDQRNSLETWLFEEGISYREAWQRARVRWDFQGTVSSARQFYRTKRHERNSSRGLVEESSRETAPFAAFSHLFCDGVQVS